MYPIKIHNKFDFKQVKTKEKCFDVMENITIHVNVNLVQEQIKY